VRYKQSIFIIGYYIIIHYKHSKMHTTKRFQLKETVIYKKY